MGAQRVIIDLMNTSHETAIEIAKNMRVVAIDAGMVVTKCKVVNHPEQDDEKHTLVSRQ